MNLLLIIILNTSFVYSVVYSNFIPSQCSISSANAVNTEYKKLIPNLKELAFTPTEPVNIYTSTPIKDNEFNRQLLRKKTRVYLDKNGLFRYTQSRELLGKPLGIIYKFVWDYTGIYAAKGPKHDDIALSKGVFLAGYLIFKSNDGILTKISNFSGHYQPDSKSLDPLISIFKVLNIQGIDKLKVDRVNSFGGLW